MFEADVRKRQRYRHGGSAALLQKAQADLANLAASRARKDEPQVIERHVDEKTRAVKCRRAEIPAGYDPLQAVVCRRRGV